MKLTRIPLSLVLLAVTALVARSDVVTFQQGTGGYTGATDTWVSGHHSSNQINDGGQNNNGTTFNARFHHDDWHTYQSLLRFDDIFGQNPGQIPDDIPPRLGGFYGVDINNATLELELTNSTGGTINFYRLTQDWDGSTVTYNSFNADGSRGFQSGSDFDGTPVALLRPDNSLPNELRSNVTGVKELDITDVLRDFLAGTDNFGFLLSGPSTDEFQFASSEHGTALRPLLTIDFVVVPEPASLAMWSTVAVLGGVVFWRKRRQRAA